MKLSHTAVTMYQDCSEKYKLHYKDKLRSTKLGSALFFGSAIDEAINRILLDKKRDLTNSEKILLEFSPEEFFLQKLTNKEHNGEVISLQYSEITEYFKSDVELDILTDEEISDITNFAKSLELEINDINDICLFVEECSNIMKNKKQLDKTEQILYNNIAWNSLKVKGQLLINAFKKDILPKIEEVFSIQEKVVLPDDDDEFIGYIDFIASFVDRPGVKFICDLKTSSRAFKEDSIKESDQLACYSEYKGIRNASFIVLEKKLRKKEPKTRTQIIRDTVSEDQLNNTFDKISNTFYNIRENKYEKNFDACFSYGRKCPYYNYCRTGELKDLIYTKRKEK